MSSNDKKKWVVWGFEASPFYLKVLAMSRFKHLPFRRIPLDGGFRENWRYEFRKQKLVSGKLALTWPKITELDEFPAVPYIFGPNGENIYDSTSIAHWLDKQAPVSEQTSDLAPIEDKALAFIISLIDEYADEYGLYMVHHYRWKVAGSDTMMGENFAYENRKTFGPLKKLLEIFVRVRQTYRCPYLFSVAPKGFQLSEKSKTLIQPPSRKGFPPTHDLLEESYQNLLAAIEPLLKCQPYLLGNRFTLADASIYGQLEMNMADPSAAKIIKQQAPETYKWLARIEKGDFSASKPDGKLTIDSSLTSLLTEICRVFVPLMQQNYKAYQGCRKRGETLFNEKAFWKNRSLYNGQLDGTPFRAVVKSFQVKIWLELRKQWTALNKAEKEQVEKHLPTDHGLDRDI
jgi:hypothetical protein